MSNVGLGNSWKLGILRESLQTLQRDPHPLSGIKDAPCAGSLDVSRQELFPTTGSVTSQNAQCDLLRAVEAEECQSQHGG